MKNILFFVRHFSERGTEIAIYDYAKYNEEILSNKSYIICFTESKQAAIGFPTMRDSYPKFKSRFPIIEINDISEISDVININNIDFFYTLTHGTHDIYQFHNRDIWRTCKTIKHCVFDTTCSDSADYHISIAESLNHKYNTNLLVIPHIVAALPTCPDNLRNELHIPDDAIVFGRYGGFYEFNISITHDAIREFLDSDDSTYFLFMNTRVFHQHPRIIYLEKNVDITYKTKFIQSCDAMIHARDMGETFGLSIAEFSICNKPVITCPCGDMEHIRILGEKAIIYSSKNDLLSIFRDIRSIINIKQDPADYWNAYQYYSPENIMRLFDTHIFSV